MSTFKVNDMVIHCREGLSKIIDSKMLNDKEYFLVRTQRLSGETIYVPVASADSIIRAILSPKAADELLIYIKSIKKDFNTNTKQRRDAYKKMLSSGEVKDIAYLYKQLHYYDALGGEENSEIKLGPVDLEMLNYASDMLLDELAVSYQRQREDIKAYIEEKMLSL